MGKDLTLGTIFKGKIDPTLRNSLKQLETIVKGLNKSLNANVATLNKSTTAQQKATTATKKVGTATKETTKAITFMGKQIGSIDGAYNRLMGAFKVTVSYGIAATAIYSVINAMKAGTQAIIDYDQGLKNLQAITSATDFEVSAMGETIKQVARDTKFSTTEAADGMTLLGQAGLNAGESMTAMRDTALLATGTLSDMKTSTDLVSTTIRAFNMSATESGRIVDVMANAVNKSKLTIDKLRTAFNYVAATASQAGLSIEATAATMMNLANNGLRASTIGTGFRQVLSKMVKPSSKLAEALASVGLKLNDINPAMVGWQGTLKALSSILYDTETKTVNMGKAFGLFGLRGAQAAAVVVKSFVSGKYQDALNKVYEIGTAEEMAAKQAEGLGVKLKNLIDRAGNVAVAFGEAGAANGIRVFLDAVREMLAGLETFIGSVAGQVIVQLGAVAGAFKLATMAAKGFMAVMLKTAAVKTVTSTYMALTTTLGKGGLTGALTTAGYVLESFLKKLNPITIALGLVAGAILTYRAVLAKSLKDAEMLAVKNMQIVDSLEAYRGAMVSTSEKALKLKDDTDLGKSANDAYIATLQRLIKAHPELTSKIEMSIDAYERNNKVVAEFTSASHAEKVRALVKLYNEYGEAAERAKLWGGVWEDTKSGLLDLWHVFTGFFDMVVTGFDMAVTGIGLILIEEGKLIKQIPFVGKYFSKAFTESGNALLTFKDNIHDFYVKLGEDSEKAKEFTQKQKEVIDTLAASYIGLGEKSKMSSDQIVADLEKIRAKSTNVSAEMVAEVVKAVEKGRVSISKYTHDVRSSLDEMNTAWKKYYDTKDIAGQYAVQQAWGRLQKQAKDYADFLLQKVKDSEISEKQMSESISAWWAKRLQEYQANEAKQTASLQKEIEKRQSEYQKFADKIKSIEEKLADDIKLLRQADMTDAEKNSDDLIAARQALADAIVAVSEATTAKELEEATKKVEIARAAYGDIVRAANTASTLEVEAQEKSTASKKAIKTEELGWFATNWELAAAREQIWNNAVIKNLKTERDLYNKWYGKKAEERATSDETAATRMKTAATEAFAVITGLLETLQEKFTKKNKLDLDVKDAEKGVKSVEEKVAHVDTIIKDGKVYKINTTQSVKDVGTLETKAKGVGTIVTAEKTYKMDASGAITSADNLKTGVEAVNKIVVDEQVYKIDTEQSKTDIGDLATNAGKVDAIVSKGVTYVVDADKSLTDTGILKTNIEDSNTAVAVVRTLAVEVPVETSTGVSGIEASTENINTNVNAEKTLTIDVPAETQTDVSKINAVLSEILSKLGILESKVWKSKHVITVIGLGALREAYRLHKALDGMKNTTSTHTTKTKTGSKEGGPVGFDRGGKLQGYGGGDTVPAMLEKGEYVIRKEKVREFGKRWFDSINNGVQKMSIGGFVMPKIQIPKFAQGGPVGGGSSNLSGQLHTINLNINNTPHQLYGDTDAVNGLVKTLRRAQLVTA